MVNIIGGAINKSNISTYGPAAKKDLENINIDVAFVASTAFSVKSGFSCGNIYDAELKRGVLDRATLKIILMDSSKTETTMPYTFARPGDIDILISDDGLSEELRSLFEENGTQVL